MTKYSRKQKYEELRSRLQNDTESEIKSRELSGYEKRLNRINSDNFEEPDEYQAQDHDPIHARRRQYLDHADESSAAPAEAPAKTQEAAKPAMDSPSLRENENYTSAYDDSYLNDYINEVKQYNIDQGNAFSTNTDLNILKSLRGERPTPAAKKPFPNEVDAARQAKQPEPEAPKLNTVPKRAARSMPDNAPVLGSKPQGAPDSTIDIPFVKNDAIGSAPSDFVDSAAGSYDEPTQTMTKEDIAAEVQSLIRSQDPAQQSTAAPAAPAAAAPAAADPSYRTPLNEHLEAERATRQQLLNETTQMRAQLDDYEDNLNDVSEKMQHTNKVLNFVLIVLIIAMLVVLAVVVYWILSSKGII